MTPGLRSATGSAASGSCDEQGGAAGGLRNDSGSAAGGRSDDPSSAKDGPLDVSVVLPTYNESASLPVLVPRIVAALAASRAARAR